MFFLCTVLFLHFTPSLLREDHEPKINPPVQSKLLGSSGERRGECYTSTFALLKVSNWVLSFLHVSFRLFIMLYYSRSGLKYNRHFYISGIHQENLILIRKHERKSLSFSSILLWIATLLTDISLHMTSKCIKIAKTKPLVWFHSARKVVRRKDSFPHRTTALFLFKNFWRYLKIDRPSWTWSTSMRSRNNVVEVLWFGRNYRPLLLYHFIFFALLNTGTSNDLYLNYTSSIKYCVRDE